MRFYTPVKCTQLPILISCTLNIDIPIFLVKLQNAEQSPNCNKVEPFRWTDNFPVPSVHPLPAGEMISPNQNINFLLKPKLQKLCLPLPPGAPSCQRAWTFESVQGYALDKVNTNTVDCNDFMINFRIIVEMIDCLQYAKKRGRVPSRENCMALCMSEKDFPCR